MDASPANTPSSPSRFIIWAGGLIFVTAVVLRWFAAGGDLWQDEIWSWIIAHESHSAADLVTRYPSDNNHLLNTLLIYWLGDQSNLRLYRLPAVIFGSAAMLVGGWIARRSGSYAIVAALAIFGSSYLQVLYSSEARGYAALVFFSLLAFAAAEGFLRRPGWSAAALFWISCILGGLAHLTFLQAYAAIFVWSAVALVQAQVRWQGMAAQFIQLHALPCAFFIGLYFVFVGNIDVGGGNDFTILGTVASAFSLALGGPESGAWSYAVAGLGVAALIVLLILQWRTSRVDACFHVLVIVIVPALLLVLRRPDALFVRYFLVSITFLLLLGAVQLGRIAMRGRVERIVCIIILTLFCAANLWQTLRLIQFGRGQYSAAVAYIVQRTQRPVISVASDHDYRNGMVLAFYTQTLPPGRELNYHPTQDWPASGTEWFLIHDQTQSFVPQRAIRVHGREFQLAHEFPYAGLSGWRWFVYHNTAFGSVAP